MALKKGKDQYIKVREFNEFEEAKKVFEDDTKSIDERIDALEYILEHKEIYFVLKMLSKLFKENRVDTHPLIDYAFSNFGIKPKRDEDFEEMFHMLKSDNAYLRNMAITFVQEFGIEAKSFIEKLMRSDDKDIRIFAINILGDVKYDKSVDMLRYFLAQEDDINAMMTAVDYIGEIGSEEDIPLLETLKVAHKDDPYVLFGVDTAIERIKG